MRGLGLALAGAAMLGACSPPSQPVASEAASGVATEASDGAVPDAARAKDANAPAPVEVSLPQLAYSYKLGFLVPADGLAPAQDAHKTMCEKMGPARCQLLALERGSADDSRGEGLLRLRVASGEASRFSSELARTVGDAGGRTIDTKVEASDVSKAIVDAEARIRQRELLVARLTEVLRTRSGKVAELVEAERSVAQAQEELDQTKAWLGELRGRVAMSEFEIRYRAVTATASPGSVGGQLGEAVEGSGTGFLIGLRMLLTMLIYLAPWALLAAPIVWLVRRRRRKQAADKQATESPQA